MHERSIGSHKLFRPLYFVAATKQQPGYLMWRIYLDRSSHPRCYRPLVAACLPDKVSSGGLVEFGLGQVIPGFRQMIGNILAGPAGQASGVHVWAAKSSPEVSTESGMAGVKTKKSSFRTPRTWRCVDLRPG